MSISLPVLALSLCTVVDRVTEVVDGSGGAWNASYTILSFRCGGAVAGASLRPHPPGRNLLVVLPGLGPLAAAHNRAANWLAPAALGAGYAVVAVRSDWRRESEQATFESVVDDVRRFTGGSPRRIVAVGLEDGGSSVIRLASAPRRLVDAVVSVGDHAWPPALPLPALLAHSRVGADTGHAVFLSWLKANKCRRRSPGTRAAALGRFMYRVSASVPGARCLTGTNCASNTTACVMDEKVLTTPWLARAILQFAVGTRPGGSDHFVVPRGARNAGWATGDRLPEG